MLVRLVAVVAGAMALLGCGDDPVKPKTPVTLVLKTRVYQTFNQTGLDTARALVIVDGTDTVTAPDSLLGFPRGIHNFEAHLDTDYLISRFSVDVNPWGNTQEITVNPAGTCRVWDFDIEYCTPRRGAPRNLISWSGSRVYCPAGDFGEFCTFFTDEDHIGGTWPVDSAVSQLNEYISHGKLMIAATVGGDKIATAFYEPGDFSPRRRHHVVEGDSSYWQSEVWTDVRHVPVYPATLPSLGPNDRDDRLLGLRVRTTYVIPSTHKNAMFIRFDIRNITDSADYRRVHPNEPVGGHTINDVYLAPLIDADVGGYRVSGTNTFDDTGDDNAAFFPDDSLVIAYDQAFAAPVMGGGYHNKPGLVGMRLIEVPTAMTSVALMLDRATKLSYGTATTSMVEDSTYDVISGGRGGMHNKCSSTAVAGAYICDVAGNPEAPRNVLIGWSIGKIASIAPGQEHSLTVAILFAPPVAGEFTSGTNVSPNNAESGSTTRAIYRIAGNIRALATAVKGFVVDGRVR